MEKDNETQIAGLNFLIAEDDEFQRRWLSIMLTKMGVQHITEATNGRLALDILRNKEHPIDISFVDLNMPDMDGMELIRHMAHEGQQTSVILTSALDPALLFSAEMMSKAYGVNLLGTIEKPVTPETLQALFKLYQTPETRKSLVPKAIPVFMLHDIAQGLENKQFEPFFQPKVELTTGKVKGVEAFARWRHPQHGLVPPVAFIPTLEANGQMDELTWIMLEKSITACRTWHAQGSLISVSINLAPSCLMQHDFAEKVVAYVAEQGMEAQYIIFEITESIAMTEIPQCLENLTRLRMNGFGLSVDDYGTGGSSMQQLLRIPFSDLKIDRSFVAGASQNQPMAMALSSSLELARKLNRHSVAVGVETRQDWDFLLELGCVYAQGYYIAKPMERENIPAWIEEWSHFF